MFASSIYDKPARGFRVKTKTPAPPAEYKRETNMFNTFTSIHQGNGFDHEAGLSNNAIAAQAAGLIPGSTLLKKELTEMGFKGIPGKFLTRHAPSCEYHHHGMAVAGGNYIKTVRYYNLSQVIEWLQQDDVQELLAEFKKDKPAEGAAVIGWIEFKEYKTLGAYNSTSLHIVSVLAALYDSGSQWSINVLSDSCTQKCVWQKSRYGSRDSVSVKCSWYKAGDSFRKSKDNVEVFRSMTEDELMDFLKKEKKQKSLAKRRATIAAKKAAAEQAALKAAREKELAQAFELLDSMEQQFLDAGADFKRNSCPWFIYSKFFEGTPNKPEFIRCGSIKEWIKSKVLYNE